MLKLAGKKYDDKQNICIVSKYVPTKYLLISKGKVEILQWKSLAKINN